MSKVLDLAGQVFGRLTVLRRAGTYKTERGGAHATWWCRCECGVECVRVSHNLQKAVSCGCAAKEPEPMEARLAQYTDRSGGPDACWLWTGGKDGKGYGRISRGRRGEGFAAAHRMTYELAHGPIPEGLFACHSCDTPSCVNPAHIFVGTAADNNRDMAAKGRHWLQRRPREAARGEAHSMAKLTEETVREIRLCWAGGGVKQRDLAARFGVNQAVVWSVIHRHTWAHVA